MDRGTEGQCSASDIKVEKIVEVGTHAWTAEVLRRNEKRNGWLRVVRVRCCRVPAHATPLYCATQHANSPATTRTTLFNKQ